ncbi:MAG: hypothetical protein P4N24_06270 [Acidobacteriota bacterium]|nr:hypothetical protein [Acidobacteriota bacterium]
MVWKTTIVLVVVLAVAVSALAWLRVYYVQDGAVGNVIWNSTEAYVFVNVYQYGYTFSYLGYLGEVVKGILPFGASPPEEQRFYLIVIRITPKAIERYPVDNFHIGSPPFVVGQNIYVGNLLGEAGLMKWSETHFVPMNLDEQNEVREAHNSGKVPMSPNYDNIGGWSRRMVDFVSQAEGADHVIELGETHLRLLTHSGFINHDAYIELSHPEHTPEKIWHLSEKPERVDKATYRHIFGSNQAE